MTTRMELWKNYRLEIEKNNRLESDIQTADKKLKILYERLINVIPEYEKEFENKTQSNNLVLLDVESFQKHKTNKIDKIIMEINEVEKDYSSLSFIDNLDFSSKELDKIILKIKKGKMNNVHYIPSKKTENITLKTNVINLGVKMKINIAIDGPSGSGKSSAAKMIADKFELKYINTGLVYRAIAQWALNKNISDFTEESMEPLLIPGLIELLNNEVVYLDGFDVTKQLRSDEVSQTASKVAALANVRKYALKIMRGAAKERGVVMDGRDITFRVMPDADLKFFIDTKPEVRAKRRVKQNKELGFNINYKKILDEIIERDNRDRNREIDPLQVVEDAILIDSSKMNLQEVVDKISLEIKKKRK